MSEPVYDYDGIVRHFAPRFGILRLIGEGGLCLVFRGFDPRLARVVAIKVLRPESREDPEARMRFVREMKLLESWSHPHLTPIHESALEPFPWYSMPFFGGFSLKEHLARLGAMPLDETLEMMRQVMNALRYVHGAGWLHRDIKPANILLDGAGHSYLADFGLAGQEVSSGLTRAGAIMGTVHYMAPEAMRAAPATVGGDLFSMGLILYECLTGTRYFELTGDIHVRRPTKPLPAGLPPDTPAGVVAVLTKLLEEDPARRFETARDADRALRAARPAAVATPQETLRDLVAVDLETLGDLREQFRVLGKLTHDQRVTYLGDPENLKALKLAVWGVSRRNLRLAKATDATTIEGVEAWRLMATEMLSAMETMVELGDWSRLDRCEAMLTLAADSLRERLAAARLRPLETCGEPLRQRVAPAARLVLPDEDLPVYASGDLAATRAWVVDLLADAIAACCEGFPPGAVVILRHRLEGMTWRLSIDGKDVAAEPARVAAAIGDRARVGGGEYGGVTIDLPALLGAPGAAPGGAPRGAGAAGG